MQSPPCALYELPAYMMKLDKRFMDALKETRGKNASFLKQVMGVCRERDLKICVCGVEEMWQAERLKELRVDYEQGYYYSSPLPAAAYEARCAANERRRKACPPGAHSRRIL